MMGYPQQPPPRFKDNTVHNQVRIVAVVGGLFVLVLIIGVIGSIVDPIKSQKVAAASPAASRAAKPAQAPVGKPTQAPPGLYPENLTFTGQVNGTLTKGLNPRPTSKTNPNPPTGGEGPYNATQCSNSSNQWEADIYGDVGGTKVSFRLSIDTGDGNLKVVGTQPLAPRATLFAQAELIGASGKYNSDTFTLEGTNLDLEYPVYDHSTITVNPDEQSGTLDIALTDGPYNTDIKETITGAWTCGPVPLPKAPVRPATPTPTQAAQVPADPGGSGGGGGQPAAPAAPAGATALCNDGTYSYSQHRRGTCSHHHGVGQWLRSVPA